MDIDKKYYVYVQFRGDTGRPFYVGKGSGKRAWDTRSRNRWWKSVVDKHGFTYKIIHEGLSECCANSLERIVIHSLKSSGENLVNLTEGGDGCRHSNPGRYRAVCCSNGMEFNSVNSAGEWAGVSASKITSVCRNNRHSSAGYTWWYKGDAPKEYIDPSERLRSSGTRRVFCSNGMKFNSMTDAARWIGKESSANINKCCKGEIESAYGYSWSYDGVPEHPTCRYYRSSKTNGKPVTRSDGLRFDSSARAADYMKSKGYDTCNPDYISLCCRGKRDDYMGYKWEYVK